MHSIDLVHIEIRNVIKILALVLKIKYTDEEDSLFYIRFMRSVQKPIKL